MEKETRYTAEEMEYALHVIKRPELRESETFRQWLQVPHHRELFMDMMAYAEAMEREKAGIRPHRTILSGKKILFRWLLPAAAAAMALLLGWHLLFPKETSPSPQPLFFANTEVPEGVMLQTGDREPVLLQESGMDIRSAEILSDTVEYSTVTVPRGKDFKLVLSDGTEVWLNAETTLRYPNRFTGETREVSLEGEAFFHVARNEAQPFCVQTDRVRTQVLGTRFNVRSYAGEASHVTLLSGSVRVKSNAAEGEGVLLRPGQDLCCTADGQEEVAYVNTDRYTAWTEGMFYFEDAPLKEIMRTLGRWYNLNIFFGERDNEEIRLNFWTDRNASVEETIKLLNKVSDTRFTLQNETIYIN